MRRPGHLANLRGFTLVELLVVIGIIAIMIGMLMPVISRARIAAQITKAHADLRSITTALMIYQDDHRGQLPPTRFSCSTRTEYELPVELALGKYLPGEQPGLVLLVRMRDVFDPEKTYRYRAPGPAIVNESTIIEDAASLWVPDSFPNCDGPTGKYYFTQKQSPVRYAVWSIGPSAASPKFLDTPGRAPVPRRFWCLGSGDTGVITHFVDRRGKVHMSQ